MAVSKRLRFEILRRDNHQCRYCGAKAPDVPLTVDHVVPVALGGSDDSSNLVAACRDCNAGKSSAAPDTNHVKAVSEDALRWASAMAEVAQQRAIARAAKAEVHEAFEKHWNDWTWTDWRGDKHYFDLPFNWRRTVDNLLDAGLEMADLYELTDCAMEANPRDEFRYFCGCAWRRATEAQERAREILNGGA